MAALGGAGGAEKAFAMGELAAPARQMLRVNFIGQALMRNDICAQDWAGKTGIAERLRAADVTISDLEVVIRGPNAGAPTRGVETLHSAPPEVLDCIQSLGINMVNTASNHAFDLNTGGIEDSIAALESRKMSFAGTGRTLAEASRAAHFKTPAGTVALVAAAAGFVREGGAATPTRPGVNELRAAGKGLLAEDVSRMLDAISLAAKADALVVAYLHDHLWEPENWRTPAWKRAFARQCIDAGAGAFFSHGAPLLQGMETYQGRPIFHGLGSFTFQTKKLEDAYGDWAWQSLIAECEFSAGKFVSARLVPVLLNGEGAGGAGDLDTRGRPGLAKGPDADKILDRIEELSSQLGQKLVRKGDAMLLLG